MKGSVTLPATHPSPAHILSGNACFLLLKEWLPASLFSLGDTYSSLIVKSIIVYSRQPPHSQFRYLILVQSSEYFVTISTFNSLHYNYFFFIYLSHYPLNSWGLDCVFIGSNQYKFVSWMANWAMSSRMETNPQPSALYLNNSDNWVNWLHFFC